MSVKTPKNISVRWQNKPKHNSILSDVDEGKFQNYKASHLTLAVGTKTILRLMYLRLFCHSEDADSKGRSMISAVSKCVSDRKLLLCTHKPQLSSCQKGPEGDRGSPLSITTLHSLSFISTEPHVNISFSVVRQLHGPKCDFSVQKDQE